MNKEKCRRCGSKNVTIGFEKSLDDQRKAYVKRCNVCGFSELLGFLTPTVIKFYQEREV